MQSRYNVSNDNVFHVSAGDLINSVQKFTDLVGWKEDMVQLIAKEEGKFVLVSIPA